MAASLSGDIIPKAGPSPIYPNDALEAVASLPVLQSACQERGQWGEPSQAMFETPTQATQMSTTWD